MTTFPSDLLEEASITYADDRGVDLEHGGIKLRYEPTGGMTQEDYDLFQIDPPEWPAVQSTPTSSRRWFHEKHALVPSAFPFGPLQGTQEQLAAWMFSTQRNREKPDARPLHGMAINGNFIWVQKLHRTCYEVWFRQKVTFDNAVAIRDGVTVDAD